MRHLPFLQRGMAALALGTILGGSPLVATFDGDGPGFEIAKAFAKNGGDDDGG